MRFSAQGREELEFHRISIDDGGVGTVWRTFAIGEYVGRRESLPPDFVSIERELQRLKELAFPHSKLLATLPRLSRRGTDLLTWSGQVKRLRNQSLSMIQ